VQFVHIELHAVEFLQQVVGKLDVCLVDLVNQHQRPLLALEGAPQRSLFDIVADVLHPLVAELGIAQPRYGVIFVKPVTRLGRGLDVPFKERHAERGRHLLRQHGLSGPRLSLDQKRSFQLDGRIDGHCQVVGRDIAVGSGKLHRRAIRFW
jgi:hypothetical protein